MAMTTDSSAVVHADEGAFDMTDRLLAELRALGIGYLSGGHDPAVVATVAADPLPPTDLLCALAACPEARVRDATIALLLLHPELAHAIPDALARSDPEARERLATLALAALYMVHLWYTRLNLALGTAPSLPEDVLASLWQQRNLPPPDELHGEWGLRCLEASEQKRLGVPFTFMSDWQNALDHLLTQEWMRRSRSIA
jgi:hypothetical protein